MIDLSQWRASIGLWNSFKGDSKSSGTAGEMTQLKLTLSLIIVLSLLLILAVHLNCPDDPTTGKPQHNCYMYVCVH